MHPQSPPLTIGLTVLKEADDLVLLGVIFDSKLTFEKVKVRVKDTGFIKNANLHRT